MANDKTKDYWRKQIKNCQKWMAPKHKMWRKLLKLYRLEQLSVEGMDDQHVVPLSRFYPLARQIIASISFHYPKVFLTVEDEQVERASAVLERAANQALELTNSREEVQQAIFDALFCSVGWLKYGYNPPGDDSIAPYVANDDMREDFPFVQRVAPMNLFVDPLTPPHRLGHARFIIERMLVPYEYVRNDERYKNRRQIKPLGKKEDDSQILMDFEQEIEDEAHQARQDAKDDGEYVELYEIHDRLHRKRLTFATGVDDPIEEIDHPFLRSEPIVETDMFGQQRVIGYEPTGGYLVEAGFPYFGLKFDLTGEDYYPIPPMEYVRPTQELVMESVSRRRDGQKRFSRMLVGDKAEQAQNPQLSEELRDGVDGSVLWVHDKNALEPLDWPALNGDQLGLEADARFYEEQMLHVSELSSQGSKRTATEAALTASAASINREWLQSRIQEAYRVTIHNFFNIMSDPRYTPEEFIVNSADEGEEERLELLSRWHFLSRFRINIAAGSMQPLREQLERDDTLMLFDRLQAAPEVDRGELLKMLMGAFRVPDADKMLTGQQEADSIKAAQLENVGWLMQGGDPGVTPGEDHETHIQVHNEQLQQVTGQLSQLQATPQMQPMPGQPVAPQQQEMQQLQVALQAFQQHIQSHEQMLAQEAQSLGRPAPPPSQGTSTQQPIQSVVQSNAQKVSNTLTAQAGGPEAAG